MHRKMNCKAAVICIISLTLILVCFMHSVYSRGKNTQDNGKPDISYTDYLNQSNAENMPREESVASVQIALPKTSLTNTSNRSSCQLVGSELKYKVWVKNTGRSEINGNIASTADGSGTIHMQISVPVNSQFSDLRSADTAGTRYVFLTATNGEYLQGDISVERASSFSAFR